MAEVAERAGKGAESRVLSLTVLKRARAAGDGELFARAVLELGRAIRPGLVDDELVAKLREAQALLGETESALSCRLQARLAAALQPAPDPQVPVAMAAEAIAKARQLEEPALLLEVLDVAGSACVEYAPAELRLQVSEDLLERALVARDFVRIQRGRARVAFERALHGGFDSFDLQAMGGQVSVSYAGPVDRLRGLLDAALGDMASAEEKLTATLALSERRGFLPWVARGRYDLANLLAATGREREARPLWQTAAQLAERCEMVGLVARATARLTGANASPTSKRQLATTATLLMVREGELYRIEHGELSARIRATRGAELLARLVAVPDQEIHVLALASDEATTTSESNAGESVDARALRQYRARLKDLGELIADAEGRADLGRVEALRREQAALEREVSRALGLGGRPRQAGSTTERARVNVQRRLKDALERISEASPELGAWLARSLRTGTYCCFRSSP